MIIWETTIDLLTIVAYSCMTEMRWITTTTNF